MERGRFITYTKLQLRELVKDLLEDSDYEAAQAAVASIEILDDLLGQLHADGHDQRRLRNTIIFDGVSFPADPAKFRVAADKHAAEMARFTRTPKDIDEAIACATGKGKALDDDG